LGTKAEVKNMNSFRAVELALNFEIKRQEAILISGGKIVQETCHWDEEKKETVPLRGKEGSSDYRYFPEPDLLPLILEKEFIAEIAESLPEMPLQRRRRMIKEYGLENKDALLLTENRAYGDFFESAAREYGNYSNLAKWVQGDLLFQLRESGKSADQVEPGLLVELLILLDEGEVNRPVAKELLAELVRVGKSPREMLQEKGLGRISGRQQLLPLVEKIIDENPDAVENYRQGKEKALKFLVGKIMASTGGRADPKELNLLIIEKLA
jgi:aspartyl-tRNA(Asn)/glutamyl-tRNA(Gln) amidotransferase subunit B